MIRATAILALAFAAVVAAEDPVVVDDAAEGDDGPRAHLLVMQKLGQDHNGTVVAGKPFEIEYRIFNDGEVDAFDVALSQTWPEMVMGATTGMRETWKVIPAGEVVTHTEQVTMHTLGAIAFIGRANVEYVSGSGDDSFEVIARSTVLGQIRAVSQAHQIRADGQFGRYYAAFAVGAALVVLLPYYAFQQAQKKLVKAE